MIEKYETNIKVDRKIVGLLSRSTYQKSFSSSIRELVSNSYDADALKVSIFVSNDFKTITIEDDGNGMNKSEFESYLTIAQSKSTSVHTRKYKRKRIGQFGVGFLAIFPYCESLEILTTPENSEEILSVTIPVAEYWTSASKMLVNEIPIHGKIIFDASQKSLHYTKFTLHNTNHLVKEYFSIKPIKKLESISHKKPFEKFKWELQEDLPIKYPPNSKFNELLSYDEPIGLTVFLNDKQLFRNEPCKNVLECEETTIAGVSCKFLFSTDYEAISPHEARGIKLRVNNVGIGPRTDFDIRKERGFPRLHLINGEILFSESIKEHLNISRDSFISSNLTTELIEYFAEKLRHHSYSIQDIAVAEQEIENITTNSKTKFVQPIKEVVSRNIQKLENKGFKLVDNSALVKRKNDHKPIEIDKVNKTIFIFNPEELERENIIINARSFNITYNKKISEPCRFISNNNIEINSSYPLFTSKTYGNLFKRLFLLLLVLEEEKKITKSNYDTIIEGILKELHEFKK